MMPNVLREIFAARAFDRSDAHARRVRVRALLQAVLGRALGGSRFYAGREAIREALAAPDDDAFFAAFARLAPLTKDDLSEHFDDLCTDPEITLDRVRELDVAHPNGDATLVTARGSYNVKKTSGTSGKLVYQVDTLAMQKTVTSVILFRALLRTLVHAFRLSAIRLRLRRPVFLIFVHRGNRSVYQGATARGAPAWARLLFNVRIVPHDATLEQILAEVNALKPSFIFGLPSRLAWLAKAQTAGSLAIAPRIVFVGGETLHPSLRDSYRSAWPRCSIVNTYGTTETKPIATACPECGELHVCEDIVHLELLDAHGVPVRDGQEASQVLATSLRNETVPVLRYELGDRIVALPDAGCRWRTQRIQVRGREPAFLWVQGRSDGKWRPLNGRMLKETLLALEGTEGFAVRHDAPGRLEVTVVVGQSTAHEEVERRVHDGVERFVRDHGCTVDDVFPELAIRVTGAEQWNREGGKLQSIHSSVEPPELAVS